MQIKKKMIASTLVGAMLLGACPIVWAATSHYNDASQVGTSAEWTAWVDSWNTIAADFTQVSLTPGSDETNLNFAWYSKSEGSATPVVHFGTNKSNLKTYTGVSGAVDPSLTGGESYDYNHVTVTGLKENTTYCCTVEKNGIQTEVQPYKTGSFETVSFLLVGDPQIGASKGQPQGEGALAADVGTANTAARNDSFSWDRTLDTALLQNPGLNFIVSAGDQVNRTGKAKEEEYAGYLNASALTSLPVATTIGNHDSLNPDYFYHFFTPNATSFGATQAGGDYYYSYGSGLFIVLNTNNYNVAEHEAAIQAAIASDPNAAWRIVTMHQDIYGSGLDHSDTDGMILRTQLTPLFDQYDVDVVFQGHDHTYSRSKLLYGDSQGHGTYEFQLNADKTDYDWDNAYNTASDAQIPLYPKETDPAGQALLNSFAQDNHCYTIESIASNTVVNPNGILYLTASSSTGSKFYELISPQQDYIAERSQSWLPSYSVVNMTASIFSINTYQILNDGSVQKIDNTFTIQKTGTPASLTTALTRGEAILRFYNAAGAPAVPTASAFSDVTVNSAFFNAVAWAKANGIAAGVSAGAFSPNTLITREQLSVMVSRYAVFLGKSASASTDVLSAYSDTAAVSPWALDSVNFAAGSGLLIGSALNPKGPVSASAVDFALTKLG